MEELIDPNTQFGIKRAMIFAAGLGTRLRPITNHRPKALVEINGIALLDIQLRRLQAAGFQEVTINVHHFADMVEWHLGNRQWDMQIHISDERAELLDTGGGLLQAAKYFPGNDPIFVCNVDVLSDLDPIALMDKHLHSGALATLAVRKRASDRQLIFDEKMALTGWENAKTGETKGAIPADGKAFAFSGIQVISPEIFGLMTQKGKFSIIDTYLQLAPTRRIQGWLDRESTWLDVGKPAELEAGAQILPRILPN